ncbi:MAG: restriction endonuclease subunit S, partial [Methanocorpusculum sp.]|nr:restriction endonuclease subunit S [Methanocorpusculum sp.]
LQGKFEYLQETCNGATIPHINRKALDNLQIPLPPLDEQKRIADVLDKASELIKKRKEQIRLMDQLARSLFIEMFGDPVENPMMWELKILGDLGAFKNGINYGQKDTGYSVKILGVGDFKSQNIFDNIDSLSSVRLTKKPNSDYFLNDGDIIFVRSNGSRELVGRNIIIYPRGKLVTFSGFCIRFRVLSERILPSYLQNLLLIPSQKSLLLENGRGCNIQNLNQQMLSSINIPLPPLSLQNEFANRIAVIEQQKALLQDGLAKMETAYKALMQEYFG